MSRSGYSDDCDDMQAANCWRGAVHSAINGKRGQAFLRELLAELDAMPEKRLLAVTINTGEGCCTLGCATRARGINTADLEVSDPDHADYQIAQKLAERLGIAGAMAQEIVYENDERFWSYDGGAETPEARWQRMRNWVASQIKNAPAALGREVGRG